MSKIDHSLFAAEHHDNCPKCGKELQFRNSKAGKFLGCTGYPACDFSVSLSTTTSVEVLKVMEDTHCPECDSKLAVKKGKFGMFIGCTNYPACHYIQHEEQKSAQKTSCPKCAIGNLVERKGRTGKPFYSCDHYPKCKYLVNDKPVKGPCPNCGWGILVEHGDNIHCPQKHCDYQINKKTK